MYIKHVDRTFIDNSTITAILHKDLRITYHGQRHCPGMYIVCTCTSNVTNTYRNSIMHFVLIIKGTIQRAPRNACNIRILQFKTSVNYTTDQSDCSLIMISLSDVFKLNQSLAAVGWYL